MASNKEGTQSSFFPTADVFAASSCYARMVDSSPTQIQEQPTDYPSVKPHPERLINDIVKAAGSLSSFSDVKPQELMRQIGRRKKAL